MLLNIEATIEIYQRLQIAMPQKISDVLVLKYAMYFYTSDRGE